MNRTARIAHLTSVALMGVFVLVVTGDGFAQSYAGLHTWAVEQGLVGWKADSFPLLVDLFILVGELGLFALALEGHRLTRRGMAWVDMALPFGLVSAGWGVSLAFNVGAVHGWTQQVTAAVAPVASMLGLLVLLRTVHRLITRVEQVPAAPWVSGEAVTAEPYPDGYTRWDDIEPEPGLERWPLPEIPSSDGQDDTGHDDVPSVPAGQDDPYPGGVPPVPDSPADVPADVLARAREEFSEHLERGKVPGIRPIRRALSCGQPRAQQVQAYLAVLARQVTI